MSLEFETLEAGEHLGGLGEVAEFDHVADLKVTLPECKHGWVLMCALGAAGCPLKHLHNDAASSLKHSLGHVGYETFRTEDRKMFTGELQQISLFAGLGLVRDDDNLRRSVRHGSSPRVRFAAVTGSLNGADRPVQQELLCLTLESNANEVIIVEGNGEVEASKSPLAEADHGENSGEQLQSEGAGDKADSQALRDTDRSVEDIEMEASRWVVVRDEDVLYFPDEVDDRDFAPALPNWDDVECSPEESSAGSTATTRQKQKRRAGALRFA